MFVNASSGGDTESKKSITEFFIYLEKDFLEWSSRLQDIKASSSIFVEYIALHTGLSGIIHWTEFCKLLGTHINRPITVFEDSQQCTRWTVTDMINTRNRAVEIKYHHVRHYIREKWLKMVYKPTDEMVADILTKPMALVTYENLRSSLSLVEVPDVADLE